MCGWPPGTRSTGFFSGNFPPGLFWLVVWTPLKNMSQIGNHPQIGVKIKHIWNHHLVFCWGGSCEEQQPKKAVEDGKMDGFFVYFLLNIEYLNMDEVFVALLLNDFYLSSAKRSSTILCQRIFQKVASPQFLVFFFFFLDSSTLLCPKNAPGPGSHSCGHKVGKSILQKTPWKKSHGYFSTRNGMESSSKVEINIQKNHGFVDFRSRGFRLRFTVYQQLPWLAANHTHETLGEFPRLVPRSANRCLVDRKITCFNL